MGPFNFNDIIFVYPIFFFYTITNMFSGTSNFLWFSVIWSFEINLSFIVLVSIFQFKRFNCILIDWLIFEWEQLLLIRLSLTKHFEILLTFCNYQLHNTLKACSKMFTMYKKYKRREHICLKSDPHFPKKVCFILKVCFNKSPLKVLKDAYFYVKSYFRFTIVKFLSWLSWSCGKTGW